VSEPLIITGMHRSGTSLLASLLQRGGVHIGERLVSASAHNPRGYFEDEEFMQLHEAMLGSRGGTILVDRHFAGAATEAETAQARELIAARAHRPLWGWKDPRTCLFLELWHDLLPDARYLFVYRSPMEVLLSLMRRRDPSMPWLLEAVEAWYAHNERLLRFAQANSHRCMLVHIEAVVADIVRLRQLLAERLGLRLTLEAEDAAALYAPAELQRLDLDASQWAELAWAHPEAVTLYRALEQLADMPSARSVAWPTLPAEIAPVVLRRAALLALCARVAPAEAGRFYAHGDYDFAAVTHDLHATKSYARSLEERAERAEAYARSLEERAERAEAYARSLESALRGE
jgi:hypothetical protein